jgi:hypothetical protein
MTPEQIRRWHDAQDAAQRARDAARNAADEALALKSWG